MGEFSCKNCEERHPGCHDHCESYRKQREEMDKKKAQRLKVKTSEFQYSGYKRERDARFGSIKVMKSKTFTSKRK